MIRLYSGSGSLEVMVLGSALPGPAWEVLKKNTVQLLRSRGSNTASTLLQNTPFSLCNGTNGFGDEFNLLHYYAPLNQYVSLAEESEKDTVKFDYQKIAETITEIGHYIRFIVLELAPGIDEPMDIVTTPSLKISSDSVQRALADAELLIQRHGPTSGVDRIHTAFHGYLKTVAMKANIPLTTDSSITELFKTIRSTHPALMGREPRREDIDKILRAIATIIDSLNQVRNKASGAHPNELVLQEAEAMLVINSAKTLLHYFDARLD